MGEHVQELFDHPKFSGQVVLILLYLQRIEMKLTVTPSKMLIAKMIKIESCMTSCYSGQVKFQISGQQRSFT